MKRLIIEDTTQKMLKLMRSVFILLALCSILTSCNHDKAQTNEQPIQMAAPVTGDQIVTVKTNIGEFKFKLLPEVAPETVEAFKKVIDDQDLIGSTLEKSFQANLIKVVKERDEAYYHQIFKPDYTVETDSETRHYPGAVGLSMYQGELPSSSFYIITEGMVEDTYLESMKTLPELYPDEVVSYYKAYGGLPSLDGSYTIFGQMVEGMEIVESIYAIEHDSYTLELKQTVTIEAIEYEVQE